MKTQLIKEIHDRDGKFVFAITGGGVSALSELLQVPGASNTVISAYVPYHGEELAHFIGGQPDQACSSKTARALAMAAYQRGCKLEAEHPVFGLGCTAALATNRDRRGDDRCYIAIQSSNSTSEISINFDKDQRTRTEEEQLCSLFLLNLVAETLAIEINSNELLRPTDHLERTTVTAKESWQKLLAGETKSTETGTLPNLVFPGAFDPLHEGHLEMIRYAEKLTNQKASLEISIFNVDKPPLDFIEMQIRQDKLNDMRLVFTNAPTFIEKCHIFPDTTFIVGADTMSRIAELKYYNGSATERDTALDTMAKLGAKFLVFGRRSDGNFLGLDDLDLPSNLADSCIKVPEEQFSIDISSTEIRTGQP